MVDGTFGNLIDLFAKSWTGHLQIHYKDYLENPTLYKTIDNYNTLLNKIDKNRYIMGSSGRIYSGGIASLNDKSRGVRIIAFNPIREKKTSGFEKKIIEGRYFSEKGEKELLIGKGLKQLLKAKLGDNIIIISQGADGSIANDMYKVVGIVDSGNEDMDRASFYLRLKDAQELLYLKGKVHEIAITLKDIKYTKKVSKYISGIIDTKALSLEDWKIFAKSFYTLVMAKQKGNNIGLLIIFFIVGIGILNVILMSILERTREYGVLKALGTRPLTLFKMILAEAYFIGLSGVLTGSLFGYLLNKYMSVHGIRYPQPVELGGVVLYQITSTVNIRTIFIPIIVVLLEIFLFGFYPAFKAAKTDPVKSLRFH